MVAANRQMADLLARLGGTDAQLVRPLTSTARSPGMSTSAEFDGRELPTRLPGAPR